MINLTTLMAISESSGGYYGGSCVDTAPGISLDEAMADLPVSIIKMQTQLTDERMATNDALVEAVINGSASQVEYILEASIKDILAKIKAFFEKIIRGVQNIIAKLTTQVHKIFMNGADLYKKYVNTNYIKGKNFTNDLQIEGYPNLIGTEDPLSDVTANSSTDSIDKMISDVAGEGNAKIKTLVSLVSNENFAETANNVTTKLQEKSTADRQLEYARKISGKTNIGENWQKSLKEELYGDKGTINYGQNGFDLTSVGNVLGNPKNLKNVKHCYDELLRLLNLYKTTCTNDVNTAEKSLNKDDAGDTKKISALDSYINAYLSCVGDAMAIISRLASIKAAYQKDRFGQAKAMFVKMMNFKEKKPDNSSAYDMYVDDTGMFDFDL